MKSSSAIQVPDATRDRGKLIRKVMTETAEEDRGRLLNYCIDNSAPQNLAFIDWVVYVSTLSLIGIVDLRKNEDDDDEDDDEDCLSSKLSITNQS